MHWQQKKAPVCLMWPAEDAVRALQTWTDLRQGNRHLLQVFRVFPLHRNNNGPKYVMVHGWNESNFNNRIINHALTKSMKLPNILLFSLQIDRNFHKVYQFFSFYFHHFSIHPIFIFYTSWYDILAEWIILILLFQAVLSANTG